MAPTETALTPEDLGRCSMCGRRTGPDTGQPPYRCRCDRFDRLAARGGRLLMEYGGCDDGGHGAPEIFRFDHASGGRSHFCRSHWVVAWVAYGEPYQELLDGPRERSDG